VNYPIEFRAAVLVENKKPLEMRDIVFDGPLEAGQILVKVLYSGICGKQIEEIDGLGGYDPYIPHMLGHEATALVKDVGPGVTKVGVGDTVVLHWMKGSGVQSNAPCYKYKENNLTVNAGWVTTFNEFSVVSENRVTRINKNEDLATSALFGCAATTGPGVVFNQAEIKPSDDVVVYGVGGVGIFVIQAAKLMNPKSLIAIDINDKSLKMAKEMGATNTINPNKSDVIQDVKNLTNGNGASKVIIVTGNKEGVELGIEVAACPADVYLVGVPPKEDKIKIDAWKVMHMRNLHGSLGGGINPDCDIHTYMSLFNKGLLPIDKAITKILPFDGINDAINIMRGDSPGRVIIKF
jgi:S-(hydroxymethyl)glutathione dehydrogenase / alcohol dehydrogenase